MCLITLLQQKKVHLWWPLLRINWNVINVNKFILMYLPARGTMMMLLILIIPDFVNLL